MFLFTELQFPLEFTQAGCRPELAWGQYCLGIEEKALSLGEGDWEHGGSWKK